MSGLYAPARARGDRPPDPSSLSEETRSYLAGFFDGEGSIYTRMSGGYPQNTMSVSNTDLASLEAFQQAFGGYVGPKTRRGNRQPAWQWEVTGPRMRAALAVLGPYLQVKGEQARLVLEWEALPRGERRAAYPALREAIQKLNQRGDPNYVAPSFWVLLWQLLLISFPALFEVVRNWALPIRQRWYEWARTVKRASWRPYRAAGMAARRMASKARRGKGGRPKRRRFTRR